MAKSRNRKDQKTKAAKRTAATKADKARKLRNIKNNVEVFKEVLSDYVSKKVDNEDV